MGDGIDKSLGGFNGARGVVGGDRPGRRADAVIGNRFEFPG